jgi:hypothetical protein
MSTPDLFNEYMRNMSYRLGEGGRLDAKIEARRVINVIARGAEDDEAPPDERLLPEEFFEPFAAGAP